MRKIILLSLFVFQLLIAFGQENEIVSVFHQGVCIKKIAFKTSDFDTIIISKKEMLTDSLIFDLKNISGIEFFFIKEPLSGIKLYSGTIGSNLKKLIVPLNILYKFKGPKKFELYLIKFEFGLKKYKKICEIIIQEDNLRDN